MDKLIKLLYGIAIVISIVFAFRYAASSKQGTSYAGDKYSQFDEQIALIEVNALLHPGDMKHFAFSVISGSTTFYGRVMMWTDALVSFIPDKIWGIEGQVMGTRLSHYFVLLLAIHLLISFFIQDSLLRLVVLLFTLVSPYFIYFSFIPKPEPFVLFFLALFLRGFIKSEWSYGKHFIWLGFAYGCKISVLPLIPVFFVLPLFYQKQNFQFVFNFLESLKAGAWTLLGFLCCIPCLFLSPVKPIFFHSYISQAFGNATKTYDDTSITPLSWLSHLGHHYYSISYYLILIAGVITLGLAVYLLIKEKGISNANLLLAVGFIQLLLIILVTKRIWPHYLFVGLTLTTIASAALIESKFKAQIRIIALLIFVLFIPQSITFANDAVKLSQRDKGQEFMKVKQSGEAAMFYLKQKGIHAIGVDITTYVANSDIVLGMHYEPFPGLKKENDFTLHYILDYGELLYTSGFQAIIFERNCPCDTANLHRADYFMKDAAQAYSKYVPSTYHLDTSFAGTSIFLKNEIPK